MLIKRADLEGLDEYTVVNQGRIATNLYNLFQLCKHHNIIIFSVKNKANSSRLSLWFF